MTSSIFSPETLNQAKSLTIINQPEKIGKALKKKLAMRKVLRLLQHINKVADPNYYSDSIQNLIATSPGFFSIWRVMGYTTDQIIHEIESHYKIHAT